MFAVLCFLRLGKGEKEKTKGDERSRRDESEEVVVSLRAGHVLTNLSLLKDVTLVLRSFLPAPRL